MLRIRLPFPDRKLSPNARRVWQASLTPKKEAREVGYFAALEAFMRAAVYPDPDKPLRLRIANHPRLAPDLRLLAGYARTCATAHQG